jgi:dihydrolipoamide dehydrogenase
MSDKTQVSVPNIGDFSDVEIIEVHVKPGDEVSCEDSLITLETDKAAMDVPSPVAGRISDVLIAVGDKVSEGTVIVTIATTGTTDHIAPDSNKDSGAAVSAAQEPAAAGDTDQAVELVVVGAGPGGYTAAFRAADLGMDVVLVERWPMLGGVCLNVGCIPSKALLHAARVIDEAESMGPHGIVFGKPEIDLDKLRGWKDSVVGRLTKGLAGLAKSRKVRVVTGSARFLSANTLEVQGEGDTQVFGFQKCIIAAGSEPVMLPNLPDDPRIMDSTGALELDDLPDRLLVVGGGIIGLEMACVYDALGVAVSVVELLPELMTGCDKDLVRPLKKRISKRYEEILLGVSVSKMEATSDGIRVSFSGEKAPEPQVYGKVLVAVGRRSNGDRIGVENAGISIGEHHFIAVDKQMRTNVPHIFAIGDIVGQPMLAHKASAEGKVAAEVAAGGKSVFDARVIPSVAYTDPEVAWVGLTEEQAKADGTEFEKGQFPWAASGRALSVGREEGFTKLLFDPQTHRLLGAGIVGVNAGELIAEAGLAIEMGSDAADIGLTIHAHPTLSESIAMAAEAYEGTLTELYLPKKKGKPTG